MRADIDMLDGLFAPYAGVGELILRLALGITALALVFTGAGRFALDPYLGLGARFAGAARFAARFVARVAPRIDERLRPSHCGGAPPALSSAIDAIGQAVRYSCKEGRWPNGARTSTRSGT
jgi:hypothetical protein